MDLVSAMSFNGVVPSSPIMEVLATIDGCNDGPAWHWIVLLESGTFAYVTGGCDYTGWDCQSNCEIFEEPTILLVMRQVPEAEREELRAQFPDQLRTASL